MRMKLVAMAAVAVLSAACGSPTAPSAAQGHAGAPQSAVTGDSRAPRTVASYGDWYRVTGPTWCVGAPPCQKIWTLTVDTPTPKPFHVVAVSHHSDVSSDDPTTEHPGNLFKVNGQSDYKNGTGGQATFSFNPAEVSCGRTQLDASMIFEDGTQELIIGVVEPTGVDCAPAPEPTPDPTPEPLPEPPGDPRDGPPPPHQPALWQTDLLCGGYGTKADGTPEDLTEANYMEYAVRTMAHDLTPDTGPAIPEGNVTHSEWCGDAHVVSKVDRNQVSIMIDSPQPTVMLSLVTYRKNGQTTLPQFGVDGATQVFTRPGKYNLTVKAVE